MMLTDSQQKYLQVIDILQEKQGFVHQIDIAAYLGYSRASVCRAVKGLEKEGLILQRGSAIVMSRNGQTVADHLKTVRLRMQEALSAYGFQEELDTVAALQLPGCLKGIMGMNCSGHPAPSSGIIKQKK